MLESVSWLSLALSWICLTSDAVAAGDVAPQIIRTVPAIGDWHVDPKLGEVIICFDTDMDVGGYSITGGGPEFPEINQRPKWVDSRTFSMAVTLEPNHDYLFGINSNRFKNFRSKDGVAVSPIRFRFRTGPDARVLNVITEDQERLNRTSWQELLNALHRRYSYYDLRDVDWQQRIDAFAPGVVSAQQTDRWIKAVARFLEGASDVHIWLEYEGDRIPTYSRQVAGNYNLSAIEKLIPDLKGDLDVFAAGKTQDNIGYVLISTWGGRLEAQVDDLENAFAQLSNTKGLIVDVRPNSGGSEPLAKRVAARFVTEPVVYAKSLYRLPDGSTRTSDRVIEPSSAARRYDRPVLVLSGRRVMSSCEAFLLMMKQAPNCRLVGERSYGSSGNPKPTVLSNGVSVFLPSWKALDAQGSCIEGTGIVPDVLVKTANRDRMEQDPVLLKALAIIRTQDGVEER